MKINNKIPTSVIQAGVALLTPYIDDLTPQAFIEALKGYEVKQTRTLPEKPLTIVETAELFGLSKPTINRFLNEGKLRRIKITRKTVKVDPESVRQLLQS